MNTFTIYYEMVNKIDSTTPKLPFLWMLNFRETILATSPSIFTTLSKVVHIFVQSNERSNDVKNHIVGDLYKYYHPTISDTPITVIYYVGSPTRTNVLSIPYLQGRDWRKIISF